MINLAGRKDCDEHIERELRHARILIVKGEPTQGEVKTTLSGKLNGFTFERAWYYYVVKGVMPLELALALWEDPLGKDDIRVGGHCGCPSPLEYGATFLDANGLQLYEDKDGSQAKKYDGLIERGLLPEDSRNGWRFCTDRKKEEVTGYIDCYHVDSEAGLRLLADTILQIERVA